MGAWIVGARLDRVHAQVAQDLGASRAAGHVKRGRRQRPLSARR
jgi:hypothetical protein